MKKKRAVVITGLGVVSPMDRGAGVEAFWQGLCQGRNTIKPLTLIPRQKNCCLLGGEALGFEKFSKPRPRHATGRCFALSLHAFHQAIEDARCLSVIRNAGLFFGTILGEIDLGQEYVRQPIRSQKKNSKVLERYALHDACLQLAQRYKLSGPCLCVSTTCSSSGDAVGLALKEIQGHRADIMIAGGADKMSGILAAAFTSTNAIADDGMIRPFDKGRRGFCVSEGAGFVVLEEKEHALRRKASIYCEVSGYGSAADAYHIFRPDPQGQGLSRAIHEALRDAQARPEQIDYINAHGVATMPGDISETLAIKKSFGRHAKSLKVSSIKSMIGHTMGACAVLDLICCVKALVTGVIPPTINYQTVDPRCDLDYTPNHSARREIYQAMSLSAGLGGQNCALVIRRAS